MSLQTIVAGDTGAQAANKILANDTENAASIAAVLAKLLPTTNKNLFDVSAVQNDKYQPAAVSDISSTVGWVCSAFIPVVAGTNYFISGTITRVGIGMYNAAGHCVRYIAQTGGLVTALAGEVSMVVNLKSASSGAYSNVQVEIGTAATAYVAYGITTPISSVAGLQAALDAQTASILANTTAVNNNTTALAANSLKLGAFTIDIDPAPNLYNPATRTTGVYVNGQTPTAFAGTDGSDYILIAPSTLYTGMNLNGSQVFRKVAFYNASQIYISNLDGYISSFTTPATAKYVRVSPPNTTTNAAYAPTGFGLFIGATPTFKPYGKLYTVKLTDNTVALVDKTDDQVATAGDVRSAGVVVDPTDTIGFSLASNTLTVTGTGINITAAINNLLGYEASNVFNFIAYSMFGVSGGTGDDVAPMHALGATIAANHAYTGYNATITAHGLTNTAIGKYWTDSGGVRFYVMRIISADNILFLSQNNNTAANPSFVALTAGTLTRSADVSLTVTAAVGLAIFPSITQPSKRVVKNGTDVITAATGSARFIDVIESYEVLNINDVVANLVARAGTTPDPVYTGSSMIRIENTYRFLPNAAVVILVNVEILQQSQLTDIMANQAVLFGVNGTTQYYVPNSSPVGALDFRTPNAVTWSSSVATTHISVAGSPDPTNPPNRVIQYYNNVGYMMGMLKTRGVGKDLPTYTARTFELRNNTGKVYPHPVEGTVVGALQPAGAVYNMVMYRSYSNLAVTRTGNRLSYFNFQFDGGEYVFIDYSGNMFDRVNLGRTALNGKAITVVEAKNAVLKSDTYNDGLHVAATYVSGQTCFIVLLIK